jgi:hypothetical protein
LTLKVSPGGPWAIPSDWSPVQVTFAVPTPAQASGPAWAGAATAIAMAPAESMSNPRKPNAADSDSDPGVCMYRDPRLSIKQRHSAGTSNKKGVWRCSRNALGESMNTIYGCIQADWDRLLWPVGPRSIKILSNTIGGPDGRAG